VPAARLARNLGDDRFIGLEYYADYANLGNILPPQRQNQQLYAVTERTASDIPRIIRAISRWCRPAIGRINNKLIVEIAVLKVSDRGETFLCRTLKAYAGS
jgi:hypothetical protein